MVGVQPSLGRAGGPDHGAARRAGAARGAPGPSLAAALPGHGRLPLLSQRPSGLAAGTGGLLGEHAVARRAAAPILRCPHRRPLASSSGWCAADVCRCARGATCSPFCARWVGAMLLDPLARDVRAQGRVPDRGDPRAARAFWARSWAGPAGSSSAFLRPPPPRAGSGAGASSSSACSCSSTARHNVTVLRGRATAEGTSRYATRFGPTIPAEHYRACSSLGRVSSLGLGHLPGRRGCRHRHPLPPGDRPCAGARCERDRHGGELSPPAQ